MEVVLALLDANVGLLSKTSTLFFKRSKDDSKLLVGIILVAKVHRNRALDVSIYLNVMRLLRKGLKRINAIKKR